MAEFLVFLIVAGCVVGGIALLVALFTDDYRTGRAARLWSSLATVVALVAGAIFAGVAVYLAGQGDGLKFAREWVLRYRPGWTVGECQPRDTDDNGYVTCTLVPPSGDPDGDDPEPIECGVNRWYHGLNVTGCKPVFYQRGGRR